MKYVNSNGDTKLAIDDFNVNLDIIRVKYGMWKLFAPYHYLSASLNKSARCFCAY